MQFILQSPLVVRINGNKIDISTPNSVLCVKIKVDPLYTNKIVFHKTSFGSSNQNDQYLLFGPV